MEYKIMEEILPKKTMTCPICQSIGRHYLKIKTINHLKDEHVDIMRCETCQHQWVNPLPSQQHLNHLYETGSPDVIGAGWPDDINERGISRAEARALDDIRLVQTKNEETNYLEIGVGYGVLFKQVCGTGIKCYGVEPGLWGRFENVYPSLEALPATVGFDIFVCMDVLEHMENPLELLKQLRSLAKPAAKLYCHFPNVDSFEAKLRGQNWSMYRPFGHLHFFSRHSCARMFENSGWKIVQLQKEGVSNFRNISSVNSVLRYAVERLGQGDQWFVKAVTN